MVSAPAVKTGATTLQWMRLKILGEGSYGVVYLVKIIKPFSQIVALKSCPSATSSLQKEFRILRRFFGCRHIVQCYDQTLTVENGVEYSNLFLDYASGGDLMDLIYKYGGQIPESDVRCYTRMILEGLVDIHERGYVHCDIKPENILVYPSHQSGSLSTLKIGDFGVAKEPADIDHVPVEWLSCFRGTPPYMSPESVKHGQITASLDIWSLGCVVAEMMTGEQPWWSVADLEDLAETIAHSTDIPDMPQHMSNVGKDFLMRCFARDPSERWTARRLMTHPFLFPQSTAPKKVLLPHERMQKANVDPQPKKVLPHEWMQKVNVDPQPKNVLLPHEWMQKVKSTVVEICTCSCSTDDAS